MATRPALVNGAIGGGAPHDRLLPGLELTLADGKIAAINAVRDAETLGKLELATLVN